MRKAWFKRLGLAAVAGWLAVAGSAAATAGCASERDEINRVQPNYVAKNDLVGDYRDPKAAPEFYVRSLIVAVQRTNPWFSDGLQDLTRRVRFEITENYLIARNAYEYIQNSDGHGGVKGKKVELITYDNQGKPQESVTAVTRRTPSASRRCTWTGTGRRCMSRGRPSTVKPNIVPPMWSGW